MSKMLLFKKENEIKNGDRAGQKFDTYFLRFPNVNVFIKCNLSNDVKAKLLVSKCKFPMEIEIQYDKDGENPIRDYFMKQEEFTNNEGETEIRDVCVITDFRNVKEYTICGKTLEDYFKENTPLE